MLTGCDVGTTVTGAHAVQGVITLDSIYDLVATLNGLYHTDAAFLMQRATGLFIRKLQRQANLFEPVRTRENGKDYCLATLCRFLRVCRMVPQTKTSQSCLVPSNAGTSLVTVEAAELT